MDMLKTLSEYLGYLFSVVLSLFSFAKWGMPWLRRLQRAFATADDVGREFGPEAGRVIRLIFTKIQETNGLLSVKAELKERALKLAIYICDSRGECIVANTLLCELFGLSSEEMKGKGWIRSIREAKTTYDHWSDCVTRRIPYRAEYHVIADGHDPVYCQTEAHPVLTDDGKEVLCYVGLVRPIEDFPNRCATTASPGGFSNV